MGRLTPLGFVLSKGHIGIMRRKCSCGAVYEVTPKEVPTDERRWRSCAGCGRPMARIGSTRAYNFELISPLEEESSGK
jgi:hypothetical protein